MSGATPIQTDADVATAYATLQFTIQAMINRTATAELVRVKSCTNNGGVSPYGFVDVVPLVNQIHGDGTSIPRGVIYRLPYQRVQGGSNAVIIDPEDGDIGLVVFAWRDISVVKADPVQAVALATGTDGTPPGSARVYDPADGVYFGGLLNGLPVNYVRVSNDEIEVHHGTKVIVTAPEIDLTAGTVVNIQAPTINLKGDVHQTAGDVTMAQNLVVTENVSVGGNLAVTGTSTGTGAASFAGGVTGAGIVLQTHHHLPGTYVAGATPVTGNAGNPL